MAGDPRNRLFVLFLDTFHVTDWAAWHNGRSRLPGRTASRLPAEARMGPPTNIDRALNRFLKASIGPDDFIAAMTPEMDPAALTFIRRPESIEAFLGTTWARRFSSDNLDPVEERYVTCYPPDDPEHRFDGVAVEMVARKREAQTIQSLRGLSRRLGELREERKGVLIVSEGWALVRPNQDLARQFKGMAPPQPPGVHVGAGGKLAPGTDPRTYVTADWQQCEADRLRLANLDHRREYLNVLNEANRVNLSFYPIDPRGLAVFDQPIDYQPAAAPRGADEAQVGRVTRRRRGLREAARAARDAGDGRQRDRRPRDDQEQRFDGIAESCGRGSFGLLPDRLCVYELEGRRVVPAHRRAREASRRGGARAARLSGRHGRRRGGSGCRVGSAGSGGDDARPRARFARSDSSRPARASRRRAGLGVCA